MTPYGAAMGMATFVGKLIRRVTGEDRRRERVCLLLQASPRRA
jgi:hypothetical protein